MKQAGLGCVFVTLAALLGGCSGGSDGGGSAAATPLTLHGVVHGGQAPIVGTAVVLRAASEQGQAAATAVATATTDSNGNYTFSFTCPSPTALMYLTGTGGNSGGGTNSAIHLMSILGPCQDLHGSSTVNELTTVAASYTLNGFIGPSGCFDCGGGLPTSVDNISGTDPGLPNAMGNAPLLVSSVTGLDAPTLPTAADCGGNTPPANCLTVRKLNTAANALAACVNSSGPTSAQCVQLFDCATVGAVSTGSTACTPSGTLPTDTLQAMLNIVRNPVKVSVPGIDDTSNRDVVFSPAFSTHFTDYTMSLNLTGEGLDQPQNPAVDGAGDIWIANSDGGVVELSPNGVPLSGGIGFAANSDSFSLALDMSGNAWVGSYTNSSLIVLDPSGTPTLNSPITADGLFGPFGIAISPNGDVWVSDETNFVSRFTASGSAVGSGYATGNNPYGVAIDASGYVFVANSGSNSISQYSPAGVLVKTITDGGLNGPSGAAIDINGNLWIANGNGTSVTKITLSGESEISAVNVTGGGVEEPAGLASDAAGNIWVANDFSVSEFNSHGVALSPSHGFTGAGLYGDQFLFTPAIDPSGNVWFTNSGNNSVTVFLGAAAPTRTPLVAAISQGFVP